MLGTLRFILAFMVLVSHVPGNPVPVNIGVVAVISFYFISGHLMQRSFERFQSNSTSPHRDFYIDRAVKLMPQYLLVVVASFLCITLFGGSTVLWFMNQEAGFTKVLLNLLLLPANYVFEPMVIKALLPHPIVPPAWSLSTEMHFYLLVPLLFLLPRAAWIVVMGLALLFHCGAMLVDQGWYNADSFGYRYIWGVLAIFMYGMASARGSRWEHLAMWLWCIPALYGVLFLLAVLSDRWLTNPRTLEVSLGALLCWPLFYGAVRCRLAGLFHRLDRALGESAYPIFICHFLAFYLCEQLFALTPAFNALFLLSAVTVCALLVVPLVMIQRRFERWRIQLRGFSSLRAETE